jgi:hypothetical protein
VHSADAGGGTGAGLPDNIVDADALSAAVAEPLTESAPIAFETAHALCPVDEAGGCRSYHAIWQYLRIAGLVRAMQTDGPLYVSAVMRLARERRLVRVLICGAADYSSLAYLAYGARQAGVAPCFDVIDLCETPLRMVRWYGARSGIAVNPICADATTFDSPHRYDVICAHSLLAAMPHASRPGLFAMWRHLLAPQGRVCFSSRINREAAGAERASKESRVDAMTREFFQRRDALELNLPVADEAFAALIRRYANRGLGRRQGITRAMIRDWCAGQGLALVAELETASIVPNARDRSSLPLESGTHARWWFEARHA